MGHVIKFECDAIGRLHGHSCSCSRTTTKYSVYKLCVECEDPRDVY